MSKWFMFNVVWYDGCDAYVSKFIGKADTVDGITYHETEETSDLIRESLNGNGEVLKFDPLYSLNLDNIIALKDAENDELTASFYRFKDIWFNED